MTSDKANPGRKLRKLGERLRMGLVQHYGDTEKRELLILKKSKASEPTAKKGRFGSRGASRRGVSARVAKSDPKKLIKD